MLRNHILQRVHEGETLEGVAGCASLAPLIDGGWNRLQCELWVNVANIAGARLKRRRRGMNKHYVLINWSDKSCPFSKGWHWPRSGWKGVKLSWRGGQSSLWIQRKNVPAAPPGNTVKSDADQSACCVVCRLFFQLTRSRRPPKRFETSLSSSPSSSEWAAWDAPLCRCRGAWSMFSNISALLWL